LCRYPRCRYLIYDNGSEFKLHFETLCDSYGIKRKPTTIENPQANTICERVHQVLGTMMRTAELDMADSVHPADIDSFIDNAVWAIHSTYHTVLKASPGAAMFGQDMLFDIPFVADWHKIGDYRQRQTDCRHGASQCGAKSNIFNLILRLFCGTCLHTTSDDDQTRWHICTNNRQTPPPWWSRSPLQRHGFDEPMPPEGWAALCMFVSMLPSKRLSRFHKFK